VIRLVATLLVLGSALSAPLLPNVPVLPESTQVQVMSHNAQAQYASGTVRRNVLSLTAKNKSLPSLERVHLWITTPGGDPESIPGVATLSGQDILIEVGRDKLSLQQVLREAYSIRLEWRSSP
jgi:hypothetical protein